MADQSLTERVRTQMPFCATLGVEVETFTPDEVTLTLEWALGLCTNQDTLHGGVVMALADSSGALCASLNLPPGSGTTTIESKTNFLAAIRGGPVAATSRPLHVGRRTIVVETEVRVVGGRLAAKVTQTQAVL
jgi:1,4-dihydroxy-2-naphthoyl-CoA hydrolase